MQSSQCRVVLEMKPEFRNSVAAQVVNHLEQFPAATIFFNLASGTLLSDAIDAIEQAKQDIELPLSVRAGYQGAAQAFSVSLADTVWLIIASLVAVYIVLGVLYESYIHPVTSCRRCLRPGAACCRF